MLKTLENRHLLLKNDEKQSKTGIKHLFYTIKFMFYQDSK